MRQTSLKTTFCLSLVASLLLLSLPSCSSRSVSTSPAASSMTLASNSHLPMDHNGGYYKVGKPYRIKGKVYRPSSDYSYDETGIASWYGQRFHKKKTANGEVFNKNELTAAHKTLPLPCLARVTNLENGRSLVVRVNDRGPFSGKRIIDLSQRAAQLLGFERKGIAKVRVQVMKEESKAIADAMRNYGTYAQRQLPPNRITRPRPPRLAPRYMSSNKIKIAKVETQELAPPIMQPPVQKQTIATFKPEPIVQKVEVVGDNNIYVQAGAFTNIDNAKRMQRKLLPIGKTVMAQATVRDRVYYRVRVGPIASVSQADIIVDRVINSGASKEARIIVD